MKQRQQQAAGGGRIDENDQRGPPPKEIRLRDRDDRERPREPPVMDRSNSYDSRGGGGRDGRDWHQDRDRERDRDRDRDRDREPPYKRPGDNWQRADPEKRLSDGRGGHRPEPSGRDRDWIEKESITMKRKDVKTSESDTMEQDRPNSRNSRSSLKDENSSKEKSILPIPMPEIVSWADEPGEEDIPPPLSGTIDSRGFSEERRVQGGGKAHGAGSHHHAPAPIPRDRLEADVRAENKQSNFVSLRRLPGREGQSTPAQPPATTHSDGRGGSAPYSVNTNTPEDQDKKQQRSSSDSVQNVWTTRSKSREQVPEPSKIVEDKVTNIETNEDSDRKGPVKDLRNRPASSMAPKSVNNSTSSNNTSSITNNVSSAGQAGRRSGPGQRRRESNSRYSDSYDDYYEEEGTHYRTNDQHGEKKQHVEAPRKSKSPDEEENQKKDYARSGGGTGNNRPLAPAAGAPFRNRRGNGRGGFDDEEPHIRNKDNQQQQRPPRFQQQDESGGGSSARVDHKIKEEAWESGHSEHSDSANNRSNRQRGGGGRGSGGGSNVVNAGAGDRRVRGKLDHNDHYKESEPSSGGTSSNSAPAKESSSVIDEKDHDRKPAPKDRSQQLTQEDGSKRVGETRSERRNEPKDIRDNRDNRDRGERNRNDRERGDRVEQRDRNDRPGDRRNDDRGNRGGQTSKASENQRYEQRAKTNLPPRLAKLDNRHKIQKSENTETHEGGTSSTQTKESTPPVQQQQQQQVGGTSWEKSGGVPSPGPTSAMASMALADSAVDKVTEESTVILDGTTPPAQTIIFENTNFKSSSAELAKGRGTPPTQQGGPKGSVAMQQQKMQHTDAKTSAPIISTANAPTKGEAVQMAAVAAAMGKKKKFNLLRNHFYLELFTSSCKWKWWISRNRKSSASCR